LYYQNEIKMKNLQIWDNGGKTLDRYTVFKAYERGRINYQGTKVFPAIGASFYGGGYYLHIEASKGKHLGKRIKFEDLSKDLQNTLINEFQS
jgi:hypothetical protein